MTYFHEQESATRWKLAKKAGVSPLTIYFIENGKQKALKMPRWQDKARANVLKALIGPKQSINLILVSRYT